MITVIAYIIAFGGLLFIITGLYFALGFLIVSFKKIPGDEMPKDDSSDSFEFQETSSSQPHCQQSKPEKPSSGEKENSYYLLR